MISNNPHHDNAASHLSFKGFTQRRIDVGAGRGQLSNSYINLYENLNVILYSCTFDIKRLDNGEVLVKGDNLAVFKHKLNEYL